jgi:hypothetical protein
MTTSDERERARDPDEPSDPFRVLRMPDLSKGAVFAGRFEIRGRIGTGAVGEVYHAFDRTARQEVALKVLFPGTGVRNVERLRRELRVVRRLSHPGIVRVWDIGEHGGFFYLVAELLLGESLRERLDREGRLAPEAAERVLREVLEALDHAHRAGVVHRDIKPSNILLVRRPGESRERAVLIDFGLARHGEESAPLTATGRFVGTPQYCAPEQIRGDAEIGPAADLYACGVTLWEMLAGVPPFRGGSDLDVLQAHLEKAPPHPSREMPAVPVRLRALALHLLEKEPRKRPASAADAARLLRPRRGAARLREAVARLRAFAVLPRSPLHALGLLAASLATIALAWWAFMPVGAEVRDSRLVWRTRAGAFLRGPALAGASGRPPVLIRRALDPLPSAVVALAPPVADVLRGRLPEPEDLPDPAVEVPFPLREARPLFKLDGNARQDLLGGCPYPYESDLYIEFVLPLARSPSPIPQDAFVVGVEHALNYPAKLVGVGSSWNPVGEYHHPGRLRQILWTGNGPSGRPRVLVAAVNNFLGPRNVVFALDLPLESRGQAPPYNGDRDLPDLASWYLPLPASSRLAVEITFEGNVAVVAPDPGQVVRFDPATGIPLDPALRGGLESGAWAARRDVLWRALADAAGLADLGHLGDAARLLEDFATRETGGPMLRSIPWYRAALLRMRESADAGRPALEAALEDIGRAARAEDAPRYTLLEAEILARLGRRGEARTLLRRWWGEAPPFMYRFEWLVLSWIAGDAPDIESTIAGEGDRRSDVAWHGAMRLADALHRGAPGDALALWEAWQPDPINVWSLHHVLLAAAALAVVPPDPERALEHLDAAEAALEIGIPLPIEALRAEAWRRIDPGRRPSPSEAAAVARSREVSARWAAHDPIAWFVDGLLREIASPIREAGTPPQATRRPAN